MWRSIEISIFLEFTKDLIEEIWLFIVVEWEIILLLGYWLAENYKIED